MIRFAIGLALLSVFAASTFATAATIPEGTVCVESEGAKKRIVAAHIGTVMLPDIVLTSDTRIVRWTTEGQVFGFLQIDHCAVVNVFWFGPHIPVANA